MSDINVVVITGRLVDKPEFKNIAAGGGSVCNFRIANNIFIPGRDGAENKTKVNFVSVFCFGRRAESCSKHLDKGDLVNVQGRIDYQEWESDKGKRSMIKIYASQVQFLNFKKKEKPDYEEPAIEEKEEEF